MGCILVIGRDEDVCCLMVKRYLASLGRDVVYLPEGRLFPGLFFSWELRDGQSSGTLESGDSTIGFDQIDGVLARFSGIATTPDDFHTKDGRYLSSEWHALMRGYMSSLSCPVINRPSPELWYRRFLRAPELISLVSDSPFRLPRTLVATRFEDIQAFFDLSGRRIRYSPLTMSSNYVIDTQEDLEKLEPLSHILPLHLSEVVSGDPIDAYVVGTRVVFDGASHNSVAAMCQELATSSGLTFCHLRLVRTLEDECYCMSLDCMPSLVECAEHTRDTIVGYLVDTLCSGASRGAE